MNILVISNNYPSKAFPNYGAFVYNLMQELGDIHEITIISPYKAHQVFKQKQSTYGKEICKVHRPIYFSYSNKNIAGFNTGRLSVYFSKRAVLRVIRRMPKQPDVIYAHFLSNANLVVDYAQKNNIPLVIASGESTYTKWRKSSIGLKKMKNVVNHIICVSKENKTQLISLGFDSDRLTVIPNAVDYDAFKPLNKIECKKKLNISSDKFVVGFIGHFIYRKGPNRIIKAIQNLKDKDIQLICVGSKGNLISNPFTKVMEPVPNYQLPEIYNAFDVFVLPTLHEGSCNVIEEAKACGIPIISSEGTSVEEQINNDTGILVDPLNIQEIAQAINHLKNDKTFYNKISDNLITQRGENSLKNRTRKINSILQKMVKE